MLLAFAYAHMLKAFLRASLLASCGDGEGGSTNASGAALGSHSPFAVESKTSTQTWRQETKSTLIAAGGEPVTF